MITKEKPKLEVGKRYCMGTFYGFKSPYSATYLGKANFIGFDREFFIEEDNGKKTYFILREPEYSKKVDKRTGFSIIKSNKKTLDKILDDNHEDDYEIVLGLDEQDNIVYSDISDKKISEVMPILRNLGGKQ